jgi:osmotically-inducible protein OsmY
MNSSRLMSRAVSAALVAAVLCGMFACASEPPRSAAQIQADKETAARVQAALDTDRTLYAKHIFLRVENGVVYLSGYVWERDDMMAAETAAGTVAGVTRVVNDLELQRNGIDDSGVSR